MSCKTSNTYQNWIVYMARKKFKSCQNQTENACKLCQLWSASILYQGQAWTDLSSGWFVIKDVIIMWLCRLQTMSKSWTVQMPYMSNPELSHNQDCVFTSDLCCCKFRPCMTQNLALFVLWKLSTFFKIQMCKNLKLFTPSQFQKWTIVIIKLDINVDSVLCWLKFTFVTVCMLRRGSKSGLLRRPSNS